MIITLNQAEIEQALRQFVGNTVTIKDGAVLEIDLRATRGADGQTAIITIEDPAIPPAVIKPVNVDTLVPRPAPAKEATPAPEPEPKKAKEAEPEVDPRQEDLPNVTTEQPQEAPAEEAPKPAARSLFARTKTE